MGLRQLWTIAVASAAVSLLCSIPCSHAIRASSDLSSDSRSTLRVLEAAGVFPSNTHGANARKRARRHGARPNGTSSNFMNTTETPFSRNGSTTNSLETTTSANGTSPVVEVTTSSAVDTTTETSAPLPEESLADTAVDFLPVGLVTRPPSVQAKVGLRAQQHPHPPLDQDATATCPLSTQLEAPRPVYLTTCAEFSSESCCTQDEDQAVLAMLQQSFEPLYGTSLRCMENLRHLLCGIYCSPLVAHAKPSNRTEPVKQNNFGLKAGQSAVAISTESCLRLWGTCFVAPRTVPAKSASADTFLALNTGEAAHARANYARRAYPSRNPVSFCESQHDALLPLQVVVSDSDEWKGHRLPLFSATNDSTVASANYYPHLMMKTQYADVTITQSDSLWIFLLCVSMLIIGVSVGIIVVFCECCKTKKTSANEKDSARATAADAAGMGRGGRRNDDSDGRLHHDSEFVAAEGHSPMRQQSPIYPQDVAITEDMLGDMDDDESGSRAQHRR